jgi:hypothetical protein
VKDLLLGLIANRAGVVQNQPRIGLILHLRIALMLQRPNHLLGVMGVHLAAKRLNIESFTHTSSISPTTGLYLECNIARSASTFLVIAAAPSRSSMLHMV